MLKRIGPVAYQLELPPTARIHNVFHVSLLKRYQGQQPIEPLTLPAQLINTHPILEPYRVLQARSIRRDNEDVQQVLVQWHGMSTVEATWEDVTYLQQEFPDFDLEDKVAFNGGGIDMNEEVNGEEVQEVDEVRREVQVDEMENPSSQEEVSINGRMDGRPRRTLRRPARYVD